MRADGHKKSWICVAAQEQAFTKVKKENFKPTVLVFYSLIAQTRISADASSFGHGAELLQEEEGNWKPVEYSRATSNTERCQAQIVMEDLSLTWTYKKFSDYILGDYFIIETFHKPLVLILNSKCFSSLPPRVFSSSYD